MLATTTREAGVPFDRVLVWLTDVTTLHPLEKHNLKFSRIACKGVLFCKHLWMSSACLLPSFPLGLTRNICKVIWCGAQFKKLGLNLFQLYFPFIFAAGQEFFKIWKCNKQLCITSSGVTKDPTVKARCLFSPYKTRGRIPITCSFLVFHLC